MNTKIDLMRFQLNNLSYKLGLSGFVLYVVYITSTLDLIPKNFGLGLEIMINLAFFMVLFLGLEKVRNYSRVWSLRIIALGILSVLRVLWHPVVLFHLGVGEMALRSGLSLLLAGVLIMASGIIGYRKSRILNRYLEETGRTAEIRK